MYISAKMNGFLLVGEGKIECAGKEKSCKP